MTFNDKLLNESSLDKDIIDRIDHNQKYNDDTIFDNFSIFQQLAKEDVNESMNEEEKRNKDLKIKETTGRTKHTDEAEKSEHDSVSPFIQDLERSSNMEEDTRKKLINLHDLAELTLEAADSENDELISYHESDVKEQSDHEEEKQVSVCLIQVWSNYVYSRVSETVL